MPELNETETQTQIVKHCPYKLCNVNKDFFYGGAVVVLLGVGYWFVRCRGRTK
jgi:hypothetical protein